MPLVNGQYRRPQLRNGKINYRYGWFFVTFQVAGNKSVLGAIVGEDCVLNRLGEALKQLVVTLPHFNPEVFVDCFVVMPNHVHLVLKIEDRTTNDENHLGKIMRKLKSMAAREYRLLKERGEARDIGSKLWQENYWEKIVTSHEQLEAIRAYIANNPKRWSLDRFGPVTTYSRGNLSLLGEPAVAFVASEDARGDDARGDDARGDALAPQEYEASLGGLGRRAQPESEASLGGLGRRAQPESGASLGGLGRCAQPIISTFTSPQERDVFRRLLVAKRSFIAVYPGGLPAVLPLGVAEALAAGRALLLSPVDTGTGINKQRAVWCNEYVIRRASEVCCGYIKPGGTLESILKGLRQSRN